MKKIMFVSFILIIATLFVMNGCTQNAAQATTTTTTTTTSTTTTSTTSSTAADTTTTTTTTSTTTTSLGGADYLPNTEDYTWIYNYGDGGQTIVVTAGADTVLFGTVEVQAFNSTLLTTAGAVDSVFADYYRYTDDAVYFHGISFEGGPSTITANGSVLLDLPLSNGKTWDYSTSTVATVESMTGTVTVQAGTFTDCVNIVFTTIINGNVTSQASNWYAVGTGMLSSTSVVGSTPDKELKSKNF